MTIDLTDRKVVKKLEQADRVRSRQDGVTLRNLMETMAGRQFIYKKLVACHIFETSFSVNALQMAFREGERNRGLELLNDIMQYCPDQYMLMMREANERHTSSERTGGEDTDGGDQGQSVDSADSTDDAA